METMDTWMVGAIAGVAGLIVGAAVTAVLFLVKRGGTRSELAGTQSRADMLDKQVEQCTHLIGQLQAEHAEINSRRESAERQLAAKHERIAALADAEKRLEAMFKALSVEALKGNSDHFVKLAEQKLAPIRDLLTKQEKVVQQLEAKREGAYAALDQRIQHIAASHDKLGAETGRLVTALRRPEVRGRWGEMQLRRCAEIAGMVDHVDFTEQAQTDDPETRDRPDMIVYLPGGGTIVVDAKVALDAYLNSLQPDMDRQEMLRVHASQIEAHIRKLAKKQYWEQFSRTPRYVVLFISPESAMTAALEVNPDLYAHAMEQRVLLATPTLLIATLGAIAKGWQEEDVSANARQIAEAGQMLYERLGTFVAHLAGVGKGLESASRAYNSSIGSMETRLFPAADKLRQLNATKAPPVEPPPLVETPLRQLSSQTEVKSSQPQFEADPAELDPFTEAY